MGGTADPEWGEIVTAWVVPSPATGPTGPDDLRDFAADRLAAFKCPRRIVFVDALPRNALGKILRHELTHGAPVGRPGGRPPATD